MDAPGGGVAPAEGAPQDQTEAAPATAEHAVGRLGTLRLDELGCIFAHLAPIALGRLMCTCKALQQAHSGDDWLWLKANVTTDRRHLCEDAAAEGQLQGLGWARAMGCRCDEDACSAAAYAGQLEALRWLRAQRPPCPLRRFICAAAAGGGHLAVLEWLRAQEPTCEWDSFACDAAAKGAHVEALQWLRALDPPCEWDEFTCAGAAGGGQLATLQWLRLQQPPCECVGWCRPTALRRGGVPRPRAGSRAQRRRHSHTRPRPTPTLAWARA